MQKSRSIFKAHQIERREMKIMEMEFSQAKSGIAAGVSAPAAFLDKSRIDDRERLYHTYKLAHSLSDPATENLNRPVIYCRKSGAPIFVMPRDIVHALNDYCSDRDFAAYSNNFIHPAWMNTSPDRLRRLQLEMPHEFCVYAFCLLTRSKADANARGAMRSTLASAWRLADVIELAELLRRALAMFGRHEVAANSIAFNLAESPAADCIAELRAWITAWIKVMQRKFHQYDSDRQRVVTLTDVKNFTLDLGVSAFRMARGNDESGMLMLADMAEIFGSDISSEFRAAVSYTAPEKPAPKTKYSGTAAPVNFDAAFTALFAATNAVEAPAQSAPAMPAPLAPQKPRMRLGTASNAQISINLFGSK